MKPETIIKPPPNNSTIGTIEAKAKESWYHSPISNEGLQIFGSHGLERLLQGIT